MFKRLCVYCGSRRGLSENHRRDAMRLGQLLAGNGITLIYGGGHVGMMGIIADATLAAGGDVIGVIPVSLQHKEVAHDGLTELHIVDDMHQRKALMAELADGFIAMPGGLGTLEELFEMLTWLQIGIHEKPVGLLNSNGYYDRLLDFLNQTVTEGYLNAGDLERLLKVSDKPEKLLKKLDSSTLAR
ncbi:MAG: TIGR00730 family Rossman fold protein [Gammaproteobacteria bacterium]|nr:TIGR00730 family Rossman fold protein [Gammaproteobacteria bacterium]